MKLGDKIRSLRSVEGSLRGLGRPLTQHELVEAMKRETGQTLSQAYLSQIEGGSRPHLTHTTRQLLARFFRVYPGFLVDDPEGYTVDLQSELRVMDAKIDSWLYAGADHFASDPELHRAFNTVAAYERHPVSTVDSPNVLRSERNRIPRGEVAEWSKAAVC